MNEVDKYNGAVLDELMKTAEQRINNANDNTKTVLEEKAVVEQDRDQYKSHYEQTVEIVKERDNTIKSRDDEIAALKAEITRKDNELNAAAGREISLNKVIDTKNKIVLQLKSDLVRSQESCVNLSMLLNDKIKKGTLNDVELSQPIEIGETVEAEETTKTL